MDENLYFSGEQLDRLKRKDLVKIASYYKIGFDKKLTKNQLRDLIWNSFNAPEMVYFEGMEAPMSTRIRRIKESTQ